MQTTMHVTPPYQFLVLSRKVFSLNGKITISKMASPSDYPGSLPNKLQIPSFFPNKVEKNELK